MQRTLEPRPSRPVPSLAARALSHFGPLLCALSCAAVLAAGCEREPPSPTRGVSDGNGGPRRSGGTAEIGGARAAPTDADRAEIAALIEGFTPLDASATSDRHDAWLAAERAALERLCRAGPGVAGAALEAFDAKPAHPEHVRAALLEIAAHGLGGELAPRLETLITTYDPDVGLSVRTEAVRILAETSPARALEFLAPLAREDRPSATRPNQGVLVECWIRAARVLGNADTSVLCDVATNIFQAPEARYAAIEGLGELGGARAGAALEEILREASSDGYVRRKAAQALVRCVSPAELCRALDTLAGHESDPAFLDFLADMIDRHCAGVAPLADAPAEAHAAEHAPPVEHDR